MNSQEGSKRTATLETTSDPGRVACKDAGSGDQSQITRRTFCNGLLLSSTALVLAARSVAGEAVIPQDSTLAYPPMKIEGAERLMPGSGLYFEYPTRKDPAVLVRAPDGEFTAYSRKCSHAGCSVEFDAARRCLKCPCHQGTYDARVGDVMYGPPRRPLDQIVLQMRSGGQLWAVGKTIGRNAEMIARKA